MTQSRHATDPSHGLPAPDNSRFVDPGSGWRVGSHLEESRRSRRPPCPRNGSHAPGPHLQCRVPAPAIPHDSLALAALAAVHGLRRSSDCPETPAPGPAGVHVERADQDRQWIRLSCANHANGNELPSRPWHPVIGTGPDPDQRGSAKSRNSTPLEANRGLGCGLLSVGPKTPIGRTGASPADLPNDAWTMQGIRD